jgi:hypothetical protein
MRQSAGADEADGRGMWPGDGRLGGLKFQNPAL